MSLLEDVFLQDEAGEAQELERIIEGDEYDDRPRERDDSDDNSEKDDEAEEDKRRVDPNQGKTKRVVKNPRVTLNPARLTGPRGMQVIPEHFKDFKFKGKGHEKDDLDLVMKKLEHWAYRLYPKFQFEDCLKKIETLGKKRPVMVHLHKIRSGQLLSEETVVQKDSSDEETPAVPEVPEEDEFDKLLQQQIELARATPGPGSVKKGFQTPSSLDKRSSLMMPKATSSPSISDDQRERMLRNRKLAEERRLARLKQNTTNSPSIPEEIDNNDRNDSMSKRNRSHIIDSSDDDETVTIDKVTVDVHKTVNDTVDLTNMVVDKPTDDLVEAPRITEVIDITHLGVRKVTGNIDLVGDDNHSNIDVNDDTIDLVGEVRKVNKNRSNVIESSDEECDMTSVQEGVVVDVHTNSRIDVNDKVDAVRNIDFDESENTTEEIIQMSKDLNEDVVMSDEKGNHEDSVEKTEKISDENNSIINSEKENKDSMERNENIDEDVSNITTERYEDAKQTTEVVNDEDDSIKTTEKIVESSTSQTTKEKTAKEIEINSNKENVDINVNAEEIMDLDFSEDF